MRNPFKRKYPLSVREFQEIARRCGRYSAAAMELNDKKIALALEAIKPAYKMRLLAVRGKEKSEWPKIKRLPRAVGAKPGYLAPTEARVEAIGNALGHLIAALRGIR